jgi:predicted short-subunit dehydrogenase-like oxidoreductase (DUF2520 family)
MDQHQFVEELYAISEATRQLAQAITEEPVIRTRLAEMADELDELVRIECTIAGLHNDTAAAHSLPIRAPHPVDLWQGRINARSRWTHC